MPRSLASFCVFFFASTTLLAADVPPAQLQELRFLAGHWQCRGTAFAFLGMPEHETTAAIDGTWVLGDRWLQVRYREPRTAANASPVEVQYLWGWDGETRRFASVAADNGGGHFVQSSRGWEGHELRFAGDMHIAGKTMKFRDVFTKAGDTKLLHRGEAEIDGKWTKLDEESCTR